MANLSNRTGTPQYTTIGTNFVNYLSNPSDAANWGVSSTGTGAISVASTTSSLALPLGPQVTTAVQIVSTTAGTKYVYARFTMPTINTTVKHMVEWFQRQGSGFQASEWQVDVYYNASSDYSGAYTRVALSTDSSAVTGIPAADGRFVTTFDGPLTTALYYEVRFSRPTDNSPVSAATLNLAQVLVGPGSRPQGAVISEWISFTPVASNFSTSSTEAWYRRVGDTIEVQGKLVLSSGAGGTLTWTFMPSTLTVNDTALAGAASNGDNNLGTVSVFDASANTWYSGIPEWQSNQSMLVRPHAGVSAWNATVPTTFASGDVIAFKIALPISQWAGSGVVNVGQNDVEYASNFSTSTTASDTSSFAYGPAGSQIQTITSALQRRVRFQTPIQSTDRLSVEVSVDRIRWIEVPGLLQGGTIHAYHFDGSNQTGVGLRADTGEPTTDVEVRFGTHAAGTANNWTSFGTYYWRVVKSKAGQAVGFGRSTPANAGIITSYAPTIRSSYLTSAATTINITENDGYETIFASHTSSQTINLPAANVSAGRIIRIKKTAIGGTVTVDGNASEPIDGQLTQFLSYIYGEMMIQCDGSAWYVLSLTEHGTFTMAAADGSNISGFTYNNPARFTRNRDSVTVWGLVSGVITTGGGITSFSLNLPVATTGLSGSDLSGTGTSYSSTTSSRNTWNIQSSGTRASFYGHNTGHTTNGETANINFTLCYRIY